MLRKPDGSQHWPSFPADLWTAVAPIRQYRLVQKGFDRIEAQYVIERDLDGEQRKRLTELLQQSLDFSFTIDLVRVDVISRGANFKFEDFVSEVGR